MSSEIVEFIEEVCGLYFRSILISKAGEKVHQHVHDYDHATYVGQGAVSLEVNGRAFGVFAAGHAIPIKAGCQHEFTALEDNTRLTCVHDVSSAGSLKMKGL